MSELFGGGGSGGGGGGSDIGCLLTLTANQTIANSTFTAISFDSEVYDTDTMHDNSTNPTRITFTTAGKYDVTICFTWGGAPGTAAEYTVRLNGTTQILYASVRPAGAGELTFFWGMPERSFSAGDYIELRVRQNSGGNLDIVAGADYGPWCRARKVDKAG